MIWSYDCVGDIMNKKNKTINSYWARAAGQVVVHPLVKSGATFSPESIREDVVTATSAELKNSTTTQFDSAVGWAIRWLLVCDIIERVAYGTYRLKKRINQNVAAYKVYSAFLESNRQRRHDEKRKKMAKNKSTRKSVASINHVKLSPKKGAFRVDGDNVKKCATVAIALTNKQFREMFPKLSKLYRSGRKFNQLDITGFYKNNQLTVTTDT